MKRIIFAVTNDLNYDQRMIRICTSLQKDGYDILLIGRKKKKSPALAHQSYQQKRFRMLFNKGKLFYLEYNLRILFFLLFQKFDMVCGIDLDTILPCIWVSRWKKAVCVYDAHEWFTEVPEVARRPAIKKIWKCVESYSIKRVKNCYSVSESIAAQYYLQYNRKFEVIRNVPVLSSVSINEERERIILYQGALNEGRGLEHLILSMKEVDAKLILAGEGELSSLLRNSVKENHLEEKVEFKGFVTPEDLKILTRTAYIGVNLLENKGMSYYYSLANKFFDYIEAGTPSVNMNYPEYAVLNQQYEVGLLVNDIKSSTIIQSLNQLLSDEKLYLRLKENCVSARMVLNWNREEEKLLNFYRQL